MDPPENQHGPTKELRLLSLDGGGIRAISELMILNQLMRYIDPTNPPKPCEYFDLIGGTSTGGLIAIMLGRLRMSVDECLEVTSKLAPRILNRKGRRFTSSLLDMRGRIKGQFSTINLEREVKHMLLSSGYAENATFEDTAEGNAITLVVAQRVADSQTVLMSSDRSINEGSFADLEIWQAARATSAAPTFFGPVPIGPYGTQYIDGGLGANNPVDYVIEAAQKKWPGALICALVSIGAGVASIKSVPKDIFGFAQYLISAATDSEATAEKFLRRHRHMAVEGRYFRFSVSHGLEDVHGTDIQALGQIAAVTDSYISGVNIEEILRCSAHRLKSSQLSTLHHQAEGLSRPPDSQFEAGNEGGASHDSPAREEVGSNVPGISGNDLFASKEEAQILERLSQCFDSDAELKALLQAARRKIGDERTRNNFAVLIEDFAQRLHSGDDMSALSRFLASCPMAAVKAVFRRLPTITYEDMLPEYSFEDVIAARDEIPDLVSRSGKPTFLSEDDLQDLSRSFDAMALREYPPFQILKEDLRRFTFPTVKAYLEDTVGRSFPTTERSVVKTVTLEVHWELQGFLARDFSPSDNIENILVLTGSFSQAQAARCVDYMRHTWPQTGVQTLGAIRHVLEHETSYIEFSETHSVTMTLYRPSITNSNKLVESPLLVEINGRTAEVLEAVEQLAWIASTFRSSIGTSIAMSQIEARVIAAPPESETVMCQLHLLPLRHDANLEPSFGSCWTPLFDRSVLAWGFPVAPRGKFVGLELPFELMLKVLGTRFPVHFQDSLVIMQEPFITFPVEEDSDGVQWHVIRGDADVLFETLKTFPILSLPELFRPGPLRRTFLGWTGHCQVKLGTEQSTVEHSGISYDDRLGRAMGEKITTTFGLRLPWIAHASLGAEILLAKPQRVRIEGTNLGYDSILQRSMNKSALLYDCGTQTGWLVPEPSLVLHISHAAVEQMNINPKHLSKIRSQIKYAKPLPDGAKAAREAIEQCESVVLYKKKDDDNKPYHFRDLILHFLLLFESCRQASRLQLQQNGLRANRGLRGWDFVDLRDSEESFPARKVPTEMFSLPPDWWQLSKAPNGRLVIFGRKLGQLITPDRSFTGLCSLWTNVPADHKFLVATIRCVQNLARPFEDKLPKLHLADNLIWYEPQKSRPFDPCTSDLRNPVQRLMDFGLINTIRSHGSGIKNPVMPEENGAVIFGEPGVVDSYIEHSRRCRSLGVQVATHTGLWALLSTNHLPLILRSHTEWVVLAVCVVFLGGMLSIV